MIIIQDKLISDAIVENQFMCNLNACKGACCWEGDSGAPLEEEEKVVLENIYESIKPFLKFESQQVIEQNGKYQYFKDPGEYGTTLLPSGACAYMIHDEKGIAKCGIEAAHHAGAINFLKPISCHLYPIRVTIVEEVNFEALNYDKWDICSAACSLGKKNQMPVYQFVKTALIRKYGADFYDELDHAAKHLNS